MNYTGVLFDLFGTIVAPFARDVHVEAIRDCAGILGIPFEECHEHWKNSFPERIRGRFQSVAENFAWIVQRCGGVLDAERSCRAEEAYARFTRFSLEPRPHALDLLGRIKNGGQKLGLVTNCAPDVPALWDSSAFAPYFDYCAFSCHVQAIKPDPTIYVAALDALELDPTSVLYVGDGSDYELSGARGLGMTPVLIRNDLSNTYDARRPDIDAWDGLVVESLLELMAIVG